MATFITANTTLNVPGTYATPWAAMDYLMDYRIDPRYKVTISVASGDYVHTAPLSNHPDYRQIEIVGPAITFPNGANYLANISGHTSGARATDNAAHLAMLKTKHSVRIECQNCSFVDSRLGYGHPTLTNMLLWSNGASNIGLYMYGALTYINNVSIHGWQGLLIALVNGGHIRASNVTLSGGGTNGLQASDASSFKSTDIFVSASNGNCGEFVKRGAYVETYDAYLLGNGADGSLIQDDGVIEVAESTSYLNGGTGFKVELGGTMNAVNSVAESNAEYGFQCVNQGAMFAPGSHVLLNGLAGYRSERLGAFIDCRNTSSGGSNGTHGVHAIYGGRVDAGGGSFANNTGSGIRIEEGGEVFAQSCQITGSGSRGIWVVNGGSCDAENATINSNTNFEVQISNAGNVRLTGVTGLAAGDVSVTINTPAGTGSQALAWT